MTPSLLPGRRALITLLVLAPCLELVEVLTTPLRDGSTVSELGHIADHQGMFVLSAICGLVATVLYVPMFLGLAQYCRSSSPRLAVFAGWTAAVSMTCFVGVRMTNAVELQMVRDGLPRRQSAHLIDHLFGNPPATVVFVLFLGGAVVAAISVGVLVWRAGLPRLSAVLLIAFNFVDLATGWVGGVAAHVLLLVALGVIAWAISRDSEVVPVGNPVAVAAAAS